MGRHRSTLLVESLTPLQVGTAGVCLSGNSDALLLQTRQPCRWLASTVTGGGMSDMTAALSVRAPRDFTCADPAAVLRQAARQAGIRGRFAGFLTALDLRRAALLEDAAAGVLVLATAGAGNAATPGRSPVAIAEPGTINIIAVLRGRLPDAALVNAAMVVTEAKSLALFEAGIRLPAGDPATGTSTDAVAVACTMDGPEYPYAGPVTTLGSALGRLVTEAVRVSLAGGNLRPLPVT